MKETYQGTWSRLKTADKEKKMIKVARGKNTCYIYRKKTKDSKFLTENNASQKMVEVLKVKITVNLEFVYSRKIFFQE